MLPMFVVSFSVVIFSLASAWPVIIGPDDTEEGRKPTIPAQTLAGTLTPFVHQKTLPDQIIVPGISDSTPLKVTYTLDSGLQEMTRQLLDKYNPDYGALVAIEPDSGRILAMVDSTRSGKKSAQSVVGQFLSRCIDIEDHHRHRRGQ